MCPLTALTHQHTFIELKDQTITVLPPIQPFQLVSVLFENQFAEY